MKKKHKLLFKYDIDKYQAGSVHELELSESELNRLTRRGCIFAPESAELTKEIKEIKPEIKEVQAVKQPEKELDNVDNKKSKHKAKVQADSTDKE